MELDEAFERVPFLRALSAADRERLTPYCELRTVSRAEALFSVGQPSSELAFVVRGRMKLVKAAPSGRQTILELVNPGELLCANAALVFAPYCCNATCMEEGTEVLVVPRRDLLALVERSPVAAQAFMRELGRRGTEACRRVEEVAGAKVEQRIALLFLKLLDRAGVALPDGATRIPIPLSRQDIADLCGTTVETTIRVMSSFKKAGVVRGAARGFVVPDRAPLEALARRDKRE